MSTYGDRGNIFVLKKRLEWRGYNVKVQYIDASTNTKSIQNCDLVMGGGSQDRQQALAISDLLKKKDVFQELFDHLVPGLFVCGAPQLLGHTYMTGDGDVLTGLGIFDMETRHFGHDKPRCIGNTVCTISSRFNVPGSMFRETIIGFENHGGRTYLGEGVEPFAKVVKGFGNNGEDGTEGAIYKNCIATYSHGPFLSKNPHIADYLLTKALEVKFGKAIELMPLDDRLEWKAHEVMLARIK